MPLVRVQTSVPVAPQRRAPLLAQLSRAAAEVLGKPEDYVMVVLEPEVPMLMAREPAPAAFVEVRAVGRISADQARRASAKWSEILEQALGVPAARVYSTYAGLDGAMWGQGGDTFG